MFLIIGGDSIIGKALSEYWRLRGILHHASTRRMQLVSASRPYIDLLRQQWPDIYKYQYEAVVFCAATTKLDECDKNLIESAKVNVESTYLLAERFANIGAYLLLLSSAKVFDGKMPNRLPKDAVCPTTEYGRQKVEIERRLLNFPNSAALRLSKVTHPELPLLKEWRLKINSREFVCAFTDMFLAPIELEKTTQKISNLMEKRVIGIHHLSGLRDISYFEFALQSFSDIDGAEKLILPVSAKDKFISSIYLDPHSTLDN